MTSSNENSTQSQARERKITVIGAGVIGLSTALTLLEEGYDVTVVAECWPGDNEKSGLYTSPWAGAYYTDVGGSDEIITRVNRQTFERLWEMSEPGHPAEHTLLRIEQKAIYGAYIPELISHYKKMPNARQLKKEELPPNAKCGVSFQTITIDVPFYLQYLHSTFISRGGHKMRASLQHISQILSYAPHTHAIIVCTGLGARSLGGVEDRDMYPVRGQTVLLDAPWVTINLTFAGDVGGTWTYIIPRRSGKVLLGGTQDVDDWNLHPLPETTRAILERAARVCPELAGPGRKECTADDMEKFVLSEGCGLRPSRSDGVRLESETRQIDGRSVPVVYNYGHGGSGYLLSWGSAQRAAELLREHLAGVA